ncbi:MAG TPA: ChbG/HpnK family deacetylase [Candidatus Handelsmanbacteria bacterium]|nr:ChbG/HpnK family deacetylase [Candidatus Handelsmanbacteria bacterium]
MRSSSSSGQTTSVWRRPSIRLASTSTRKASLDRSSSWHRARSLTTSSGYFCRRLWPSGEVREAFIDLDWQLDETEAEFRAQIERVLQHLPATHLTGHMGVVRLDKGASPWTGRV